MGLSDLFRPRRNGRAGKPKGKDPSDPYSYDSALFKKFYRDLKWRRLPKVPAPTQGEIAEQIRKKASRTKQAGPLVGAVREDLLRENDAIPAEVDLWVEKVYDHYFRDLRPMLGLVHRCNGARKALYNYKGYPWHTISELYPTVHFD